MMMFPLLELKNVIVLIIRRVDVRDRSNETGGLV